MTTIPPSLQNSSARPSRTCEPSTAQQARQKEFEEYMRISEIDEDSQRHGLFSLIEEEEETKPEEATNLSSAPFDATLHAALALKQEGVIASKIHVQELEALFEKMAVAMIVQTSTNASETTLQIDNPASLFHGMRITISEYSTAPRIFNVEIASHDAAIAVVQEHKAALLKAFTEKDFNFSIHRLEAHLKKEEEEERDA